MVQVAMPTPPITPISQKPATPSSGPNPSFGGFQPQMPKKKSPMPMIITAILVLALAGAGYYFLRGQGGLLSSSFVVPQIVSLSNLDNKVLKVSQLSLDAGSSAIFDSLKVFGALPVTVDSLGRSNPFVSY